MKKQNQKTPAVPTFPRGEVAVGLLHSENQAVLQLISQRMEP